MNYLYSIYMIFYLTYLIANNFRDIKLQNKRTHLIKYTQYTLGTFSTSAKSGSNDDYK